MRGAILLLCVMVLAPSVASAEPTRDEVMAGAERCAGIADNRAWLDCFYGSAQPMRTMLVLPPAPATQTRLVPPPGAVYVPHNASTAVASAVPRERSGGFWSDLI